VLSGAGLSTESGIPDYRGPSGAARPATPMTFQAFTGSASARRRYWARSHLGWRVIARAEPNAGHRSVAQLQDAGLLTGVVTQNVDGLHTAAGARDVVELHGNLDRVVCLSCGRLSPRQELDRRLRAVNRAWRAKVLGVNPDGDVDLPEEDLDAFRTVDCDVCGGVLKARRRLLRRDGAGRPGRPLLLARGAVRRAAGSRVLADRDVGLPLRAARRQARDPGRDRQLRCDAR
jgi:NAD-dependent SIR2 family protein deacetylase